MIVIATAMGKEFDGVCSSLSGLIETDKGCLGRLNGEDILVVLTGIGKVNAAISITSILEKHKQIERVISIGCAGATSPNLNVGDIIVGSSFCYHDVWCGEPNYNGQVQGAPKIFPAAGKINGKQDVAAYGTIASGDWFVQSMEKAEAVLNYLPKSYNIIAIDMESAALAHVCSIYRVPFDAIRIISDNLLLSHQEKQYANFWQAITSKRFKKLTNLL